MKLVLLIAISIFSSISIGAQVSTLKGLVTDPNGAVIPRAKVIIRSGDRVELETQTDFEGVFLANVRDRQVSIEISATCFLNWQRTNFQILDSEIVDFGPIALARDNQCGRIVDHFFALDPHIEARESSVSSQIQNRPLQTNPDQTSYKLGGLIGTVLLTGVVYDPVGAIIPNIHVVAKNSKGRTFEGVTDKYGIYELKLAFNPNRSKQGISVYEISAGGANSNFKRTVIRNLKVVSANDGTMRLDLVLEVMRMKVGPCRHGAICL